MSITCDKVSVIVPIYSVEKYIRRCAESLCSQTYHDIEFIFVNDGSPDGSMPILQEVLEAHPEIKARSKIINQANKGLPQARITGIAAATGDWIIHVDSDDWVEPDYVESLVEMAVQEKADMVYCDFLKEYDSGKKAKLEREKDFSPNDGAGALKALHNSEIRAYMWNKLIHRSLYDATTLIAPVCGYHEDIVFQTQLLFRVKKCVHLERPLYHYRRMRKGALTSANIIKSRKQSALNMLSLYDALPEKDSPKEVCGIDLLWRGGWYCAIIFDWKMLAAHPDAVDALIKADYRHGYRVPVGKQAYTKLVCRIIRLFSKYSGS